MHVELLTAGEQGQAALVRVEGALVDGEGANELRKALKYLIDSGQVRTIVDLSGVSWCDSVGVGILVSHYVSATQREGRVVLLGASEKLRTLFDIARLADRFEWVDDLETAVERVGAPP